MTLARRLRYLVAAAVLIALVAMALWPQAMLVDAAVADRGSVRDTLEAEGRTRLQDRYVVTAPVAALARRITLEPGDPVRAGQTLVVLDPVTAPTLDVRARAEAEARLAGARASQAAARENLAAAEAAARQAKAEADRLKRLAAQGMAAVEAAERAETAALRAGREAESARFRLATAGAEVEAAQAVLARGSRDASREAALELVSPVDGVVLRRHFESARPVQAGDPIVEVGDPAALEIEVDVLSADAVRLREGMRVELVRWGEDRPLLGHVARIEPGGFTKVSALGVEEQRVWVIVALDSPRAEWARLGEAYRVNARFVLREAENVARVPSSAVFRYDDGEAVFRIEGGRARLAPVRTGVSGGGWVEVREGLDPGERVVVHPDRELEDEARVEPR